MFKKTLIFLQIIVLSLGNYQLAKIIQESWLHAFPNFSYQLAITVPWFLICILPCLFYFKESGLVPLREKYYENWRALLLLQSIVLFGLLLFFLLGITKYFHSVKYPLIFFLTTPLVEELLFRGWIYGQFEKMKFWPIIMSAAVFALHHLQYFGYKPTTFAIFQIGYTFLLGLLFGLMRKKSGSIYPSLVSHILINFVTVYF